MSGGRNGFKDTCACQSWSNAFSTLMKRPYRPLRAAEVDWTTTVISPSGHACELIDPVSYDSRLSWSSTFGGGDGGGDGGLGGGVGDSSSVAHISSWLTSAITVGHGSRPCCGLLLHRASTSRIRTWSPVFMYSA